MKVGFYVTGSATGDHGALLEQIEYADESGLDSVWLRERHFHADHGGRNFFASPFVAAANIAARTRRVRIGLGARILPLDHPLHVAEAGATVDVLSGGRLDFGVARIGENEGYEAAFGISREESRERFEEAFEIIVRAWTQERFSYAGRHFRLPEVGVYPKPVADPHPPLYLVALSPATMRFGAERSLPIMLAAAQAPAVVRETQDAYSRLLEECGFDPRPVVSPVNRFLYVAETTEQAVEDTREAVIAFINRGGSVIKDFLGVPDDEITYDLLFREVCIFGDPESCVRRIRELEETIDLRSLLCTFNYFTIDNDRCVASMQRFVDHVLPEIV